MDHTDIMNKLSEEHLTGHSSHKPDMFPYSTFYVISCLNVNKDHYRFYYYYYIYHKNNQDTYSCSPSERKIMSPDRSSTLSEVINMIYCKIWYDDPLEILQRTVYAKPKGVYCPSFLIFESCQNKYSKGQ